MCELRSRFGFLAFHGGNLERMTDEIALTAASRAGASVYAVVQAPPTRLHIASSKVTPEASTTFARFLDHVDVVVALHGYGRAGYWTSLLLGGGNRDLARQLAQRLRPALDGYTIVDDLHEIPADLRGMHRTNPVNLPSGKGVQLELPPRVRGLTPHAAHEERADGRIPSTNAVIDALVATARDIAVGPTPLGSAPFVPSGPVRSDGPTRLPRATRG